MDLSIVIVNYNGRKYILDCLESICQKNGPVTVECIVVDNASTAGSVDAIRQRFPDVRIIANRENRFFSAANNQGIEAAQGRYVMILNPDTLVKGDTLTQLVRQMETRPEIGAATTTTFFLDGELQRNGSHFVTFGYLLFNYTLLGKLWPKRRAAYNDWLWYPDWDRTTEKQIDILPGYCILASKETWQAVGGLQPELSMYFSDDYVSRAVQHLGKQTVYLISDGIVHYEGTSTRDAIDTKVKRYRASIIRIYLHDLLVYTRLVFGRPAQVLLAVLLIPTWAGLHLKALFPPKAPA
jgi:GT2 family glycosyltransferase